MEHLATQFEFSTVGTKTLVVHIILSRTFPVVLPAVLPLVRPATISVVLLALLIVLLPILLFIRPIVTF